MFDIPGRAAAFRLPILVGAAALALGGLTAAAQAFPAAPATPVGTPPDRIRYDGDRDDRVRHPDRDRREARERRGDGDRDGMRGMARHPDRDRREARERHPDRDRYED